MWHGDLEVLDDTRLLGSETVSEHTPERKHCEKADEANHEARPDADALQPYEWLANTLCERVIDEIQSYREDCEELCHNADDDEEYHQCSVMLT